MATSKTRGKSATRHQAPDRGRRRGVFDAIGDDAEGSER